MAGSLGVALIHGLDEAAQDEAARDEGGDEVLVPDVAEPLLSDPDVTAAADG